MPLPEFNHLGDLPEGVHKATFAEVLKRFGGGPSQRQLVTERFDRIYRLAQATGKLERFVIFGSFVTAKPDPNDIDLILVMNNDFRIADCDDRTRTLFDHIKAQELFGASIFSVRPEAVLLETVDEFIAYWQIKRDKTRRGIVEVIGG